MSKSTEILNAFRNKYYTDGNNTENGIVANALDEILPEYIKLKRDGVKHGKWVEETEQIKSIAMMPTFVKSYRCSECGRKEPHKEPYCNCGARMDGEEG